MADHDHIERLIPWYANGTLNEAEMDAVNEHLRGCLRCKRSLNDEVRFAQTLRQAPAGLEQLGSLNQGGPGLAADLHRRRPQRRPASAAALLSLLLLVASGAFLTGQRLQQPLYEAMTAPPAAAGPVIQVVLEPGADDAALERVLDAAGGGDLRGPSDAGIYRVTLPPGSDPAAREARLRDLPEVRWVAREDG